MIAWQDALNYGLLILSNTVAAIGYMHTRFASKTDLKLLVDGALQRFDATKESVKAVSENLERAERQALEVRKLLDQILLQQRTGG